MPPHLTPRAPASAAAAVVRRSEGGQLDGGLGRGRQQEREDEGAEAMVEESKHITAAPHSPPTKVVEYEYVL